jgi:hypothetical protein
LNLCDRRLELPPDFAQAVDPEVLTEDVPDLDLQRRIPPGALPIYAAQARV